MCTFYSKKHQIPNTYMMGGLTHTRARATTAIAARHIVKVLKCNIKLYIVDINLIGYYNLYNIILLLLKYIWHTCHVLMSHIKQGMAVLTQDQLFSSILTIPMHSKTEKKHMVKLSVQ